MASILRCNSCREIHIGACKPIPHRSTNVTHRPIVSNKPVKSVTHIDKGVTHPVLHKTPARILKWREKNREVHLERQRNYMKVKRAELKNAV